MIIVLIISRLQLRRDIRGVSDTSWASNTADIGFTIERGATTGTCRRRTMPLRFELAYLFGYAPWDRWRGKPLRRLRALFEGPQALRPGRALDLGCGMGRATIYLAQLGWKATGIDAVERALRVARRRAARSGVEVEFVHGDVTHLDRAGLAGPFDLFLDLGCFHILSDQERRLYGESITRVAAPDARLVLFAFGPNKLMWGPRGATREDIERSFSPGWTIVWSAAENELPYRIPRGASATWYLLQQVGPSPTRG